MKRNWMAFIVVVVIIGVTFVQAGEKFANTKNMHDLLSIVTVLKGENIDINEWSLHAREKITANSPEDIQDLVRHLKNVFPDWAWETNSDSEKWESKASKTSNQTMEESIQILSTLTDQNPQTYIIYEIQGKNFTRKTEQFIKEDLNALLSDIFREKPTIFTCVKGDFNDKINTSLPFTVNRLLDKFEATEIESLNETDFISTSAYSPKFTNGLTTNNQDMNLQLGIRTTGLGAKTTLVVGTPIITIEY
ncbi:YwmB family TATA-box binding protein [Robertmurraya siralis]|uniref:YwmB family TATA-box binding protein n=1 Tax=Robertmurraya siralis TaxID=77777 RepID=UPI0010F76653|nr:YwmB family TATA-box binding protein [Robertmurraya siralis]